MGIILALLALAVAGTIIVRRVRCNSNIELTGLVMMAVGIVFLCVACLIIIGTRVEVRSEMLGFEQTRITIENARSNEGISEYEVAALQQKVIEYNSWLVITQYWQRNLWVNWFIPASVHELEPLK